MVETQAITQSNLVVDVFASVIVFILSCTMLLLAYHGLHFRWLASVILTSAMVIDCEMHFHTNTVSYEPNTENVIHYNDGLDALSMELISRNDVLIITGLVGAGCFLAAVYTSIYRARMVKRRLAAQIRKTTNKLSSAQLTIESQKKSIKTLTLVGLEWAKTSDAIASIRPVEQSAVGQGQVKNYRALAQALVWSFTNNSTAASLQESALYHSAHQVAPFLFGRHQQTLLRLHGPRPSSTTQSSAPAC